MRTYIYKLTYDRGGAPCAPQNPGGLSVLTLSICKPAIRRTAQPGDRIVGLTSRALADREGYPLHAVIYAAIVTRVLDAREYYSSEGEYQGRPDCIYTFCPATGMLEHSNRTQLHADPGHARKDIGRYPYYRNARILLCEDFRYFGRSAIIIPKRLTNLIEIADKLGQGHRVIEKASPTLSELDTLFKTLWKLHTTYTPSTVEEEMSSGAPKRAIYSPRNWRRL